MEGDHVVLVRREDGDHPARHGCVLTRLGIGERHPDTRPEEHGLGESTDRDGDLHDLDPHQNRPPDAMHVVSWCPPSTSRRAAWIRSRRASENVSASASLRKYATVSRTPPSPGVDRITNRQTLFR